MRTMNFARALKKYGDVDLVYLTPGSNTLNSSIYFQNEYCIDIKEEDPVCSNNRYLVFLNDTEDRITRLVEKRPHMISKWSNKSILKFIEIIEDRKYDLILCRYISNSYPLFKLTDKYRKRVIIDFDDFYSDTYLNIRSGSVFSPYVRAKRMLQNMLIVSYQKKSLNFGAALFCSRTDLELVAKYGRNNIYVIPNTYPNHIADFPEKNVGYENIGTLLFIGTLNYGPNTNGIKWFINAIFKYMKDENKNIKLLIVGRQPTEEIRELCKVLPGIDLHADAEDILPFYHECGVVVVPILTGGGTRIKILEAGMASRPVISTKFGAYGLDVTDGKDIMLFENRETFMEKYNMLKNKDTYITVARNMKANIEEKYSQDAFRKEMHKVVDNIIN